jgi:hypothetical protein
MLIPTLNDSSRSATEESPIILWILEVMYRVHKSPTLVPIHVKFTPAHSTQSYFSTIQFIIIFPLTYRSSDWSNSLLLSHQTFYIFQFFTVNPTCLDLPPWFHMSDNHIELYYATVANLRFVIVLKIFTTTQPTAVSVCLQINDRDQEYGIYCIILCSLHLVDYWVYKSE